MRASSIKIIRTLFVIVPIVVIGSLHWELDKQMKLPDAQNQRQWLPSAEVARLCSLGYERLLADLYWLGFIQYMGELPNPAMKYEQAYQYVDLITSLDPHFSPAYWFGVWSIGYWQKRPDLADKLIQRGIANMPTEWYMPFMGGVNQYIFAHNAKKAAVYYKEASVLPGAPDYLARQAIILASPMPEYEKKIKSLGILYHTAKDPNLKQSAYNELIAFVYKIYKEAPTELMRKTARERLLKLGVDESEL